MNDPILEMTESEILDTCFKLLSDGREVTPMCLIGLIIDKLQEWGVGFRFYAGSRKWNIYSQNESPIFEIFDFSLSAAFLRTAQALGHWSPPKKVEEHIKYFRNKESGLVVTVAPEDDMTFGASWERVAVTPYKENL